MLKLGKINREKMCKIIQKSTIYSTEQVFDKNTNFKISLGGGVHSFNALIYNIVSNYIRRYNSMSTAVL